MLDINDIYENGKLFDGHYKLINLLITADGAADVWLAIDGKYQFRSEFKKVFSCHDKDIIQPTDFNIHEGMPYWVLPYCHRGAFAYMYPERFIEGIPPMPESDILASGATLDELITGDDAYCRKKDSGIPSIKQNIPDSIKDLIYSCLVCNPKERFSARSIVDTVLKKRYGRCRKNIDCQHKSL